MRISFSLLWLQLLLWFTPATLGIQLNIDNDDSIKAASKIIVNDLMLNYNGNQPGQVPGLLPQPYYWWEAGAMMMVLIDYWYYTGDSTYNDIVTQAMLHQVGPNNDFMPPNQTKTEGNDDQGFWAFAAMSAAEMNFPNPPADQPQWLALAQAVFNTQVARWDTQTCNGGLRWQIFTFNNGFDYKNSISNGCFFNLAARLARYTGNQTYADWAEKAWDWMQNSPLMTADYRFYDGAHVSTNCTNLAKQEWTYIPATFMHGAANMYNLTGSDVWRDRTQRVLNATTVFYSTTTSGLANVMYEAACEAVQLCNVDQRSFKAYLARFMAATTQLAPFTFDFVKSRLRNSAVAAAAQCTGGSNGTLCGRTWLKGAWDGNIGVGEQMSALEIVQSNLIHQVQAPVTANTGGTSQGDPAAGSKPDDGSFQTFTPPTAKDKAGAALTTVVVIVVVVFGAAFMIL